MFVHTREKEQRPMSIKRRCAHMGGNTRWHRRVQVIGLMAGDGGAGLVWQQHRRSQQEFRSGVHG